MKNEGNKKRNVLAGPTFGYTDVSPKREMWQEIANELNGEFHLKMTSSNAFEIHHTIIPHNKWKIEISVSDTRPLKFHIDFHSHQVFEMELGWESWVEKIRKRFGTREVEVGSKEFDRHYFIKSDKPHLVKEVLTKEIQECFQHQNVYSLSYSTKPGTSESELNSTIQKAPGNKEMIIELINAFKLLADNLEKARIIR